MNVIKNLFLGNRFYYGAGLLVLAMMLSYPFPLMLPLAKTACILFAVSVVIDIVLLFNKNIKVQLDRKAPTVLSLGDENTLTVTIVNKAGIPLKAQLVEELPEQLQIRNFEVLIRLNANSAHEHVYSVRPTTRGEYAFGQTHLFIRSPLELVTRRISANNEEVIPVYPSIIQMKKYEIKTVSRTALEAGLKKVRRIGHSYEFEHIKQYLRGDDYRSINWKATSRRAQLMVNQFEDEKSQPVYCIIDKSRVMYMPFNGLSLFDYAVNSALVISNTVLGKQDKAGLITFARTPRALVKAERGKLQIKKIIEALYREKEDAVEANYEAMYSAVRKFVNGRSLLFLYTNFESSFALQRVMPQLRRLNDQHLLVVIFFENTEITKSTSANVETLEDIYTQATAENYALGKIQIVQQLRQVGISSILTTPEQLTVSVINKYLELKARGMI